MWLMDLKNIKNECLDFFVNFLEGFFFSFLISDELVFKVV